ncbi:hypothetical protein Q8G38_00165 [Halomonas venusta]|uniref:hypothetical protein n=1 Tax=Vreelandella venusta TaxID=44935 RepID=UPI00295E90BA|nr:hypothetical protein [Halomonas venusta]MDW0357723.1 hypothetical protein [Halomonas venusta]
MKHAICGLNGEIKQIVTSPYYYIPCDSSVMDDTHYLDVEKNEIRHKRAIDLKVSVSGLTVTIDELPIGLTVETNGFSAVTDSEPVAISYDVPGTYQIRLSGLVEYLDYTEEVTVGDP